MPSSFGKKLSVAFRDYGQLCVGIDPHESLLADWGLPSDARGLKDFASIALEASAGRVGIVKPQVSFFERFGSAGFSVLEDLAIDAAESGLLVIMDAKRGDIGSTMQGYFDAWLSESAPFVCDALTVNPYLGFDSLTDFFGQAQEGGKGVFVLAATSNPEAASLQGASRQNQTVAASIYERLEKVNSVTVEPGLDIGNFGAVVGATVNLSHLGLNSLYENFEGLVPILAPGFGAQGAKLRDYKQLFGASSHRVIASVSRSVLVPNNMASAIDSAKRELSLGSEHE